MALVEAFLAWYVSTPLALAQEAHEPDAFACIDTNKELAGLPNSLYLVLAVLALVVKAISAPVGVVLVK